MLLFAAQNNVLHTRQRKNTKFSPDNLDNRIFIQSDQVWITEHPDNECSENWGSPVVLYVYVYKYIHTRMCTIVVYRLVNVAPHAFTNEETHAWGEWAIRRIPGWSAWEASFKLATYTSLAPVRPTLSIFDRMPSDKSYTRLGRRYNRSGYLRYQRPILSDNGPSQKRHILRLHLQNPIVYQFPRARVIAGRPRLNGINTNSTDSRCLLFLADPPSVLTRRDCARWACAELSFFASFFLCTFIRNVQACRVLTQLLSIAAAR